jgi:hypothetical protein
MMMPFWNQICYVMIKSWRIDDMKLHWRRLAPVVEESLFWRILGRQVQLYE